MPVDPPQGVKLETNAFTPSLTPMVASAKYAPRSRRMPSPKSSATRLTRRGTDERRGDERPAVRAHQPHAQVAAQSEEDDVAEIDVAGVADHQVEVRGEDDVDRREQQLLAQLDVVVPQRQERERERRGHDQPVGRLSEERRGMDRHRASAGS